MVESVFYPKRIRIRNSVFNGSGGSESEDEVRKAAPAPPKRAKSHPEGEESSEGGGSIGRGGTAPDEDGSSGSESEDEVRKAAPAPPKGTKSIARDEESSDGDGAGGSESLGELRRGRLRRLRLRLR